MELKKHSMESGFPVWQLPIRYGDADTSFDSIDRKAKYHCFCAGKSMCGRYEQNTDYYKTDVESGEILSNPDIACKICFKRWKKAYGLDTEEG